LAASTISRSARFFLLAFLIKKHGNRMEDFINKYFNLITIVFTVVLIGSYVLIKFIIVP
jgi:inactivated superfamily I helicase